jgi:hypothetical protein
MNVLADFIRVPERSLSWYLKHLIFAKNTKNVLVSSGYQHLCFEARKKNFKLYKKFSEELIDYFTLIRHGLHRKRLVQQFFYCCVCIRCRGNVFTEPLLSDDRGIHIQTHRLVGGIYLWSTPLRWAQLPWYTYQVSQRLVQAFKRWWGGGYRDIQPSDLLFFSK